MSPAGEYARALLRKAREDQYVAERLAADLEGPGWVNRLTPFGVTFRYEDMGEEEVEGDRDWSVRAALRTVEWAEQALEAANSPSEGT